jgi:hypothetical protein
MVKVACIGAVIVGLREHLLSRPLRYALLVLLRIRSEVDLTPPFKQKSMLYGGYDPVLPDAPYSTRRSTSALAPAFDQPIGLTPIPFYWSHDAPLGSGLAAHPVIIETCLAHGHRVVDIAQIDHDPATHHAAQLCRR